MLNVLQIDWPILLVICAFLWSLLSSKFAWWLSGVVSKCWWLRILVVIVVWIAIILLRIVLFVRLLFKGLMPWNQVHAWYVFTRLVECYVDYKKDTLVGVVLAVLIQVDTKRGADNKDFTADDLAAGVRKCDGMLCDEALTKFLKVLYSVTRHDQDCMSAVFSLLSKPAKDAKWLRKVLGKVAAFMSAVNIQKAQKSLIDNVNSAIDKIITIVCDCGDREVAYECVCLKQMMTALSEIKIHSWNSKRINAKIEEIAHQLNRVGAMLYVMVEMKKFASQIKLLEYKKSV